MLCTVQTPFKEKSPKKDIIMTKIFIYHDTRRKSKDEAAPLRLRITKGGETAYITTGVSVSPAQWDAEHSIVHGHPEAPYLNSAISVAKFQAERMLADLRITGRLATMSARQVRDAIEDVLYPERAESRNSKNTFCKHFEKYMQTKQKPGTLFSYRTTWNHMHRYDSRVDSRSFEDIDVKWLEGFDRFLAKTAPSRNARNIHYRNIRTVFNRAIDDGITSAYPFRKFKIRPQETAHRALTVEQVRQLRDYPCEPHQEPYRDMFILMIYLAGINAVDLFTPGHAKITRDRIEYFRTKTQKDGSAGKFISVKIEPEAQAYLDRYYDYDAEQFHFMAGRSDYKSFLQHMSRELKRIGPMKRKGLGGKKHFRPIVPDISQYWSRHTWASLAIECDVPENIVSYALGHDTRIATTSIYIKVRQKKLDAANRAVIDFING